MRLASKELLCLRLSHHWNFQFASKRNVATATARVHNMSFFYKCVTLVVHNQLDFRNELDVSTKEVNDCVYRSSQEDVHPRTVTSSSVCHQDALVEFGFRFGPGEISLMCVCTFFLQLSHDPP